MPDHPSQVARGEAARRLGHMSLLDRAAVYERMVCPPNLYFLAKSV
jgi:hypothetical protein